MGNNNKNMGTTWAQQYIKGVVLITISTTLVLYGPNAISLHMMKIIQNFFLE